MTHSTHLVQCMCSLFAIRLTNRVRVILLNRTFAHDAIYVLSFFVYFTFAYRTW